MIRQAVRLEVRNDPAGAGHFGAPRSGRTHDGVDYVCTPEQAVLSPVAGVVTKLGYCYEDDLSWRYVQVTDERGRAHRLFYVQPSLTRGTRVTPESIVGVAQDITRRHPDQGMLPHIHYEVMENGDYLDPEGMVG